MFQSIFNNFGITNSGSIAAAALVAGMAVFLIPAAPKAEPQAIASHFAKTDRGPILPKKIPCTFTSWPHYEAGCLFDLRASSGDIRTVRIIALR